MKPLPSEPANAIRAKDDFWSLGPSRSLKRLLAYYQEFDDPEDAPALSLGTLQDWHDQYEWRAYCAEREARISEKTEALMEQDRIVLKQQRLRDQGELRSICADLLPQIKEYVCGFHREVVADIVGCDEETGEPEYKYSVQMVPNLTGKDYINLFPKLVSAIVAVQREQRVELGEDTQRFHVTIEQVVNALPAQWQAPMREALYEELLRPRGVEMNNE